MKFVLADAHERLDVKVQTHWPSPGDLLLRLRRGFALGLVCTSAPMVNIREQTNTKQTKTKLGLKWK
jgi:hypothetical protein